ncbi:uncharacterized protein Z519_07243 [Cladophialophora bantiana CBS 173.52]|uniref:Uncharacterized protein n=1 Tax=Cladophialophora bantiana (strain ATCC 10958 / CBS 173.52 / CDC B-1940 / NIH 8579) TaxID=1442370 RepID=A0A0D2I5T7_CLAB1|nr:uncharacterized protein Z519_07243 [Cladophialophora bantiana CBS 173.52]KIW92259.1 hypothetical protein Z519_07243 [Cladophialophora bantiana CBS 173.52]
MENTEIRRGDFVYKDTLFIDLGPNKRHPRASTADLKGLLLPKRGSAPRDQVAHWYEAQLLHYGLPRTKDKNTAKVRLTNALSAKTLSVPQQIVKLETEMEKECARTLRKAKTAATKPLQGKAAGKATATATTTAARAKKGGGSSSSKTTIELEIDGMKVKIDRDVLDAAKKSTESKDASSKKPKGAKATSSSSNPKPAATSKSPAKPKATLSALPKPQTARRSQPFPRSNTSTRPVSDPLQHVGDHTPVSFHHDVEMDDNPPAYESLGFDEPTNNPGAVQISGTYFIPRKPVFPFDLTLQLDHRQQKLWGRFNVGSKIGVLHADDISRITTGGTISFGWRSEDDNDGNVKFGRGCDGSMEFDREGWVNGHFRMLMDGEDVDFQAQLMDEDGLDVTEMKHLWDEFPRRAYGRH